MRFACTAAVTLLSLALSAPAQVSSTFDGDDEGWGTLNDARDFHWTDSVGNPPGAVRATDLADGRIWYFSAPGDYLGDASWSYGGSLRWDMMLIGADADLSPRADVMLEGGGLSIGIAAGVNPLRGTWTDWSAAFEETGWRHIDDISGGTLTANPVTQAEMMAVLGDLDGLFIRGEYTNGPDTAALDNVTLIPAPGAAALLAVAVFATRRRR